MLPLPNDVMAGVSSLQWLNPEQIRKRYAKYLTGCEGCERVELLRSIVIYRMQEEAYNIKLPPQILKVLERAIAGESLTNAPADTVGRVAKRLVREYQGKKYEVLSFADGSCEWEGQRYKSLTAAATAITGTHWNGPRFFGVK